MVVSTSGRLFAAASRDTLTLHEVDIRSGQATLLAQVGRGEGVQGAVRVRKGARGIGGTQVGELHRYTSGGHRRTCHLPRPLIEPAR